MARIPSSPIAGSAAGSSSISTTTTSGSASKPCPRRPGMSSRSGATSHLNEAPKSRRLDDRCQLHDGVPVPSRSTYSEHLLDHHIAELRSSDTVGVDDVRL